MATDFQTIYGDVQAFVKDTSAASLVLFKKFANRSYRDAWTRHHWRERVSLPTFLAMTAPYVSTSSITATVTNGSAVVTLAGSTLPSYAANVMKFALSIGGEWYGVLSRDSTTQITLDRNYLGADASAQAFVIYRDVYALATDVGTLLSQQMVPHIAGYGAARPIERVESEGEWGMPHGLGVPTSYVMHDRVSGAYRVRFGPLVPDDDDFAFRYSYLKDITELSGPTDEPLFHEDKRDIILWGALAQAYQLHGRNAEAKDAYGTFEGLIARAWRVEKAAHPLVLTLRTIDGARGGTYPQIQFPVVAP